MFRMPSEGKVLKQGWAHRGIRVNTRPLAFRNQELPKLYRAGRKCASVGCPTILRRTNPRSRCSCCLRKIELSAFVEKQKQVPRKVERSPKRML